MSTASFYTHLEGTFRIEVSPTPDVVPGSPDDWIRHVWFWFGDSYLATSTQDADAAELVAKLRAAADEIETWAATRAADVPA